jgi:hypothetical protein
VTSVAYKAEPPSPGWLSAAGGLLVGWIVAGIATGMLYVIADSVGAISRTYPSLNDWATPDNGIAINEWPYPDNGLWSLLANVAVVLLVLMLTTVATSWWMGRSYDRFSESRLVLVLLLTGWLPLKAGGPVGGFFGFLVAVLRQMSPSLPPKGTDPPDPVAFSLHAGCFQGTAGAEGS